MADLKELRSRKMFGGQQKDYSHTSAVCKCPMKFSIYAPSAVTEGTVEKFPVLYFLGGLTSYVDLVVNTTQYQKYASENNLVVVVPDSSPRMASVPWYGLGASWYLDATTPELRDHFQMFSYVTKELVEVIEKNFDFVQPGKRGISGHSMGGHGALICFLKNTEVYTSFSCFAPVSNASSGDLFQTYLGTDKELWKEWDACELMKRYTGRPIDMLVDVGTRDQAWDGLKVWQLVVDSKDKDNINLDLKIRAGYDHSNLHIGTFIEEHVKYHADILHKK